MPSIVVDGFGDVLREWREHQDCTYRIWAERLRNEGLNFSVEEIETKLERIELTDEWPWAYITIQRRMSLRDRFSRRFQPSTRGITDPPQGITAPLDHKNLEPVLVIFCDAVEKAIRRDTVDDERWQRFFACILVIHTAEVMSR